MLTAWGIGRDELTEAREQLHDLGAQYGSSASSDDDGSS